MHSPTRATHTIDADGKIVGRLATQIAMFLMGKTKATYAPHMDGGDYVIIKNVRSIKMTGSKLSQNEYKHYSGYPGGLKRVRLETMFATNPKKLLWLAVYRMLPKNKLRQHMIKRLTIE